MNKNLKLFWKLYINSFKLSAFTFGGGYVIVPLMKKQFVDKLGWIEEKEMLDFVAIAQSSPGAIAVNTSVLVGFRLAGVAGAVVTLLGTVTPCIVLLTAISYFYVAFSSNVVVQNVLHGMQAGVSAVILDVIYSMGSKIIKSKSALAIIIMLLAFAAVYFLKVNVAFVVLISGVLGMLSNVKPAKRKEEQSLDGLS